MEIAISEIIKQKIDKLQAEMKAQLATGEKKRGGINSRRADLVCELMTLMCEHTLTNLQKNALKRELEGWEQIKDDPDKRRDWAKMVYNRRFKYWLGRTARLSPDRIYIFLKESRQKKNPPAYFNWLLNNHLKEIHSRA